MRTLASALAALTLALSPLGAAASPSVDEQPVDFSLETLDGKEVHLSATRGEKATLLLFWAAWSPRSAEALGDYQKLFDAHQADGLEVVAVNVEHQEWDPAEEPRIREVSRTSGVTYPLALDKDLSVFASFGFTSVPSSVLLDASGKVAGTLQGYPAIQRHEFREQVLGTLEVVAARQPEPVETEGGYVPRGKAASHLRMGQLYFSRGKRTQGLNLLAQAVEEDPNYREAYRVLAASLAKAGRTEEAERVRAALVELVQRPCPDAATLVARAPTAPCP